VKSCKKLKITRKNGIREELQRVPWNWENDTRYRL
jgi:hypothetical protein